MSSYQYTTIQEMMDAYYGTGDHIAKADDPVLSSTTGVYNPIFGAMAFSQLNSEGNAFALLPKYPWQHSGYRAVTARPGSTADGGIAENGAIPDTTKPTFQEITITPKQVSHTFESSYIQDGLVKKGDDALGDMDFLRGFFASHHALRINEQLCVDVDTLAGNGFESVDRICSSNSEVALVNANDADIYGIDRDAGASWADAVVSHNSGTDRYLTLELISDTLATLENNGAKTNIILTGTDTKWRVFQLAESEVRYQGIVKQDQMAKIGVNGVSTEEGLNYGVRVATVYNIPMFASQAVVKDTISRIYLLDTTDQEGTGVPRLGIALLYPTMYFESGIAAKNADPFTVGKFNTKGAYYTAGELVCTFFKAQGKIRDLK